MCLAELGVVTRVDGREAAEVRRNDRTVRVSLLALDEPVSVGDWLVVHAGFALSRLAPDEAAEALAIRSTAGKEVP